MPCPAVPRPAKPRRASTSQAPPRLVPRFHKKFPKHAAKCPESQRPPALLEKIEDVHFLDLTIREDVDGELEAPRQRHCRPDLGIRNALVEPRHRSVHVNAGALVEVAVKLAELDRLVVPQQRDERLSDAYERQHRVGDVLELTFVA